MKSKLFLRKHLVHIVLLFIVFLGYQLVYGISTLMPTNNNWLLSAYHDWGQHYLGWEYYRNENWSFPIGKINNFNYPAGTNVGYMDSIPLLAIFFKSIQFFLPEPFQYFGFWLLLCHFLIIFYAQKIITLYTKNLFYIVVISTIIAFNPVIVFRGIHPALCAHWLILASLYNYLINSTKISVSKHNKSQILLLILASLINPYITLMIFGFNVILPLKHFYFDKLITIKTAIFYQLTSIVGVVMVWLVIGMISFQNSTKFEVINSYGDYSLNLNSFYNSGGFASILSEKKLFKPQQYEGYSYLGVGLIIIVLLSLVLIIINKKNIEKLKQNLLLLILPVILLIFAITNKITFNENEIFSFPISNHIIKLGNVFRASGRFVWVFYYVLITLSLIIFIRWKIKEWIKSLFLTVITIIQIYDLKPLLTFRNLESGIFVSKKIDEGKWIELTKQFKRIITYPPFENNLLTPMDYQDLCNVASYNRMPITTGYVARETTDVNAKFRDSLKRSLDDLEIDSNNIYITTKKAINDFYPLIYSNKVKLKIINNYYFIYSSKRGKKDFIKNSNKELKTLDSINSVVKKLNHTKLISNTIIENNKINSNIEEFNFNNNVLKIKGWAFLKETKSNNKDSIYIFLENKGKAYLFKPTLIYRPDITSSYSNRNLDNSGFTLTCITDKVEKNKYNLGIAIKKNNEKLIFQKNSQYPFLDLRQKLPPKKISKLPVTNRKFVGNIDSFEEQKNFIFLSGWAAIENINSNESKIKVYLKNKVNIYEVETEPQKRTDVSNSFKNKYNYDDSGFYVKIKKNQLIKGKYEIGVQVENTNKYKAIYFFDKQIEISN